MSWFTNLFSRRHHYDDISAEIREHLDEKVDELVAAGMPRAEAIAAARRQFGNVTLIEQRTREIWQWSWLDNLFTDIRYALRTLRKSPGFTAVAILTLALGIGANTAVFSLADQVLLRLLPVSHPEQLVVLSSPGPNPGNTTSDGGQTPFSYPMYKDLRDSTAGIVGLLARFPIPLNVASQSQSGLADGELVSGNYFQVLGVEPALGRIFTADDETAPGANPVAVVSYAYWSRQFGANPAILNSPITVNGTSLTVVGVSRAGFTGIQLGETPDVFIPITMKPQMTPNWGGLEDRKTRWIAILGRLKPGFDARSAQVALQPAYHAVLQSDALISGLPARTSKLYVAKKIFLDPGAHGRTILQSEEKTPLIVVIALSATILLIAAANLAGLLLARSEARQREFGVRLALGAGRGRIVAQLLTEGLLITGVGAIVGVAFAAAILRVLAGPVENGLNFHGFDPHLDLGMLAFGVALAIVTGSLFSLPPALRSSHLNPQSSLQGQSVSASTRKPRAHFRKALMVSEIALTTVLLSAAVLFVSSLRNLEHVNLGLKPDHVIQFAIAPELNRYTPAQTVAIADRLRDNISTLPGVRSVSAASLPVLADTDSGGNIVVEGYTPREHEDMNIRENQVGPAYFATMGTALMSGREFNLTDNLTSQKVAIINQRMASQFFAGRNPLGLHFGWVPVNNAPPDIEIVGVVQDSKHSTVRGPIEPYAYFPYAQDHNLGRLVFYVRTSQDPSSLAPALATAVRRIDPDLALFNVRTLETQLAENTFSERMLGSASVCIGGLASLLAAIGLYGLIAYVVSRRTHEIGIRRALGASRANVAWLVLREVAFMYSAGLFIGIVVAVSASRLVASQLYAVRANNPFIFVAVAALIAAVALAAATLPTQRATRVDPMTALRHE
jgi:predicted permease